MVCRYNLEQIQIKKVHFGSLKSLKKHFIVSILGPLSTNEICVGTFLDLALEISQTLSLNFTLF